MDLPDPARAPLSELARAWWCNGRIGWPERLRGLHYWLGFEYALLLQRVAAEPGQCWLDVGSGAHSIFPLLMASWHGTDVTGVDVDPRLVEQRERTRRAAARAIPGADRVRLVRADARALPFADGTFDGFTAVSTLEHIEGAHGDRRGLQEAARVLRPGGVGFITVPFRAAGSVQELDEELRPFQWHYSQDTLRASLIDPSGLRERYVVLYGERLGFYDLSRRLPGPLGWLHRPWDSLLTAALLRPVRDPERASAVLVALQKDA